MEKSNQFQDAVTEIIRNEAIKVCNRFSLSSVDTSEIVIKILNQYKEMHVLNNPWKELYSLYIYLSNEVGRKAIEKARGELGKSTPINCSTHGGAIFIRDVDEKTRVVVNYEQLIDVLSGLN